MKNHVRKKKDFCLGWLNKSERVNRRLRLEFPEAPIYEAGPPPAEVWALPVGKEGTLMAMKSIHAQDCYYHSLNVHSEGNG